MGLGIEIPVEIFIDRHGFDLPGHRCTITRVDLQVTLGVTYPENVTPSAWNCKFRDPTPRLRRQ